MRSLKSGPIGTALASASARRVVWLGGLVLVLAGCQNDGIEHYQIPKPPPPPVYRMLGAIVPQESSTWVFKVSGLDEAILEHKPQFDRLLDSVTFAGGNKPPAWKLPEGWRQEPGDQMRFATLLLGPHDRPLELTVSRLDRKPEVKTEAILLANVNRWRGQMGLADVDADRVGEIARPRPVHGVTFYVVELTGPKPGKTAPGMGMAGEQKGRLRPPPAERGPARRPPFRYTTPPGWKEAEPSGSAVLIFEVGDGAEVKVTSFERTRGMEDVGENVQRWRGQVRLPEISPEQARREATDVRVDGAPGSSVDLSGPAGQRLLVVMAPRGDLVWFFKMLGPAQAVAGQKAAFEAFVQSVHFE
jgi:hypothetical protein